MKSIFSLLISSLLLVSCNKIEPRRPIQKKSGSFIEASVERSKKLLAQEENYIKSIIEKDTVNTYLSSNSGFWFYYNQKIDSATYLPQPNDEVILSYNLLSLQNDTIYSTSEVGETQIMVDKSQLFPGLRNALKLLKEGESATFLFPSSQAFGYKGDNNKIGPNMPLKTNLKILKIIKQNDSLNPSR